MVELKGRTRISKGTREAHDLPKTDDSDMPRSRLNEKMREAHDLPRYKKGGLVKKGKGRKKYI